MADTTDVPPTKELGFISGLLPRVVGPGLHRWLAIFSLSMMYQMALGGVYTVNSVLYNINEDLGPSPAYPWLLSAATLTTGVLGVVMGQLGDVFGRRWVSMSTGISAIIAAVIGIRAQSIDAMIASQIFIGGNQAGSSLLPASISELVTTKYRGTVLAFVNCLAAVWNIAGSLIAHSLLAETAGGWRNVYWLILAVNLFSVITTYFTYFPDTPLATKTLSRKQVALEFDYVGLLGIIAGPLFIILGIIWIPTYGATSAHFLGPFLVGVALLFALGTYEVFVPKNPILHPFLWRRVRTFTFILIVTFVTGMVFFPIFAFFPVFLSSVYDGADSVKIGVDSLPLGTGNVFGGLTIGFLLPVLGPRIGTTPLLVFGPLFQILFLPMLSLSKPGSKSIPWAFSFLGGMGLGAIELLTILLIQLAAPDEWIGFACGSLALSRSLGGAAGNAIFQTVLQNKEAALIPGKVGAAAIAAGLPASSLPELLGVLTGTVTTVPIEKIPGISAKIIGVSTLALQQAYIESFNYIWYVAIPFMFVSLVVACCCKDLSSALVKEKAQRLKTEVRAEKDDLEKKEVEQIETVKTDPQA